jgi:hypothetical protein
MTTLQELVPNYHHMAETDNDINPSKVDSHIYGPHISYERHGKRIWGFEAIEARDKFIMNYNGRRLSPTARETDNPIAQNIPIRTPEVAAIKKSIGLRLQEGDYAEMELRILAMLLKEAR